MARVLVTGVSRDAGARTARALATAGHEVTGVDAVPPAHDLAGVRFVRADIRNPGIGRVISGSGIEICVHTGVVLTPGPAGGRSAMKEINVIGSMQLLAACQRTASIRQFILKSSATVYGSGPTDPAWFTEQMSARSLPAGGLGRDIVEIEGYVRAFAQRRPDVTVTVLRMANWIGPRIDSPLTRYLRLPVIPAVLGFDPRLQFLHENDGVDVVEHAVQTGTHGTFNVAGDGVLVLSKVLRLLGRPVVRVPGFSSAPMVGLVRRSGVLDFPPDQLAWLTYGRVTDTTAMRTRLGFEPGFTTAEAYDSLLATMRPGRLRIGGVDA